MKTMTKRELLLTDKYDDNDAWSILEKYTIVDRLPKGKSGKNVWVSRFNATFEQSLALLFRNDGISVVSINGTKRKLGMATSDGINTANDKTKKMPKVDLVNQGNGECSKSLSSSRQSRSSSANLDIVWYYENFSISKDYESGVLLEKIDTNTFSIRLDGGKELQVHNKQLYFPFGRKESKVKDLVVVDLGTNDNETNRVPDGDLDDGILEHTRTVRAESDQVSEVSEDSDTFQWGDNGELNADGLVEHRRLERILNGEKTIIEVGDTVSLNGPEGSHSSFIAKIDRMWQAATVLEGDTESGMNIRTRWYFTVRRNSARTVVEAVDEVFLTQHENGCRKQISGVSCEVSSLKELLRRRRS